MERRYTVDELNSMTRAQLRDLIRPLVETGELIPLVDKDGFLKGNRRTNWGIATKPSLIRYIRDRQGDFSLGSPVEVSDPYKDVSPRTKGTLDATEILKEISDGRNPNEADLPEWEFVDWRKRRELELNSIRKKIYDTGIHVNEAYKNIKELESIFEELERRIRKNEI